MSSAYDDYQQHYGEMQQENKEIEKMFELIAKFKEATYEERVQIISERYGELKDGKIIKFGSQNNLTITKDLEGIFHFEFNFPHLDFKILQKHMPEDADKLRNEFEKKIEERDQKLAELISKEMFNEEKLITSENIHRQLDYNRHMIEQQIKKKREQAKAKNKEEASEKEQPSSDESEVKSEQDTKPEQEVKSDSSEKNDDGKEV